jgi:hypothetical protein
VRQTDANGLFRALHVTRERWKSFLTETVARDFRRVVFSSSGDPLWALNPKFRLFSHLFINCRQLCSAISLTFEKQNIYLRFYAWVLSVLKGQCHGMLQLYRNNFDFFKNSQSYLTISVLHGVNDAGNACIAGAVDIGQEFLTGINDNSK